MLTINTTKRFVLIEMKFYKALEIILVKRHIFVIDTCFDKVFNGQNKLIPGQIDVMIIQRRPETGKIKLIYLIAKEPIKRKIFITQ